MLFFVFERIWHADMDALQVTGETVLAETFTEDLQNGIALCKLMIMIGPDTGVQGYHALPGKNIKLDAFKAKENVVQFQEACRKLSMPVMFGMSEIEAGDYGKIASTLVFVAHTASTRGVGVQQMDAELRARVQSVAVANASVLEEAADTELTWWQQLLIKLGLGDWVDFDLAALKAYALKVKEDLAAKAQEKIEPLQKQASERVMTIKENLPEAIKARLQ